MHPNIEVARAKSAQWHLNIAGNPRVMIKLPTQMEPAISKARSVRRYMHPNMAPPLSWARSAFVSSCRSWLIFWLVTKSH